MQNSKIRSAIQKAGLTYWAVADKIGIHPATLCVWLRHELTGERLSRVEAAIAALSEGGNEA